MTDTNKYRLFRRTNAFKETKRIINNIDHMFEEKFDEYPTVASDSEVGVLTSLRFDDIERSSATGPEEKASYMYETPSVRIWLGAEFEPATGSEPRGDDIIGVTGRVVLRDSEEVFRFETDTDGRTEFSHK